MKPIITLFLIAIFFIQAQAQKMKAEDVPLVVTTAFSRAHPAIRYTDWRKIGNNYEVMYDVNRTDILISYDSSGKIIETVIKIVIADLPHPTIEYVKKNYRSPMVKNASKITDKNNLVSYQAEVNGKDLIFDSQGNFVKTIEGF